MPPPAGQNPGRPGCRRRSRSTGRRTRVASPATRASPSSPHPDPPPQAGEGDFPRPSPQPGEWNFPEPPVPSADGPDEFDALQVAVEMVFELGFERLLDLVQDLAGQPESVIELALAGR